jgi:hypothetical protein
MKKLLALTALAFSLTSASAFAESLTGVVADAMCAKDAAKASSPDHAACAKKCIKGGEPAVLIVGSKVYAVSNPDKLTAFAGKTVTVDGTVSGDTLTVNSVK